ncbi:hypothetical protein CDD83_5307 [Cordyceps sp. RAO-2017]|nr:hypothetical protein CDD83_5307 [Cordyceps sp. RAO-2017]
MEKATRVTASAPLTVSTRQKRRGREGERQGQRGRGRGEKEYEEAENRAGSARTGHAQSLLPRPGPTGQAGKAESPAVVTVTGPGPGSTPWPARATRAFAVAASRGQTGLGQAFCARLGYLPSPPPPLSLLSSLAWVAPAGEGPHGASPDFPSSTDRRPPHASSRPQGRNQPFRLDRNRPPPIAQTLTCRRRTNTTPPDPNPPPSKKQGCSLSQASSNVQDDARHSRMSPRTRVRQRLSRLPTAGLRYAPPTRPLARTGVFSKDGEEPEDNATPRPS